MDWYDSVFEVIDMRSFSNLWYWIGLAVFWSTVSHWVLGVPYDSVLRAKRGRPESAMQDLEDHVRVSINRMLHIAEVAGVLIALFGSAFMTALALAAFAYHIEFAKALFLLLAPFALLALLTLRVARKLRETPRGGAELIGVLARHRLVTQSIGAVSIFVTAMYGMYVNLSTGPFGGF
ncbi:MAG: component of SufBCD complex [Silicimonas sp.]|nr:component of SufBCD complex [Silicimonas sp.]